MEIQCDKYTYDNYVHAIIIRNCINRGCHGAGFGAGDFTRFSGVKEKVNNGSFRLRVLDMKVMPPVKSLSSTELEKIKCWLDNGAK